MTLERPLTGERPMIASGPLLVPLRPPPRTIELTIDGAAVQVPEGSTILDAIRAQGKETPTICYLETLHPVNVCRVCVVEVEGSRVRLFAGCGIVADSDPGAELAEAQAKFVPVRDALVGP